MTTTLGLNLLNQVLIGWVESFGDNSRLEPVVSLQPPTQTLTDTLVTRCEKCCINQTRGRSYPRAEKF